MELTELVEMTIAEENIHFIQIGFVYNGSSFLYFEKLSSQLTRFNLWLTQWFMENSVVIVLDTVILIAFNTGVWIEL